MGYDIYITNPETGERWHFGDLTFNYNRPECHKYWQPRRDLDENTVGEAIANLERATSQMIADGFDPSFLLEYNILESMLKKMFLLYAELIKVPREFRIELES